MGREIMQKPLTLDIEILEIFATKPEGTSRALLMRKEANDAVTDGDVVGLLLILDVGGAKGSGRRGKKKGGRRGEEGLRRLGREELAQGRQSRQR